MKKFLFIVMFFTGVLSLLISNVQAQELGKLTMSAASVSLQDIFNAIKKQTGYTVFYNNSLINDQDKIKINFSKTDVKVVLSTILQGKNITWTVNDRLIILKKNQETNSKTITGTQQNSRIKIIGTVMDKDDHSGIPGVTIKVKNSNNTAVTGANGFYSIATDEPGVITFSSIGYQTVELSVNTSKNINIELVKTNSALNEVVVVGYGTQRKSDVSNSVSSMSSSQIEKQVTGNVLNTMAGQMSGVEVRQGSGRPGDNPTIRIRGSGSINASNAPLYVVDGLPLEDASDINSLNPNDIATIDVLKDAAAAAIYGSRGGNGVVIVTTKKGKAGQAKFDFSAYTGINSASKRIKVLDKDEYIKYQIEGYQSSWIQSGGDPNVPNASRPAAYRYLVQYDQPENFPNTDWQSEIMRSAPISNYQLGAQGGSDKFNYYVSGNYFTQQGIIKATDISKYNMRANINSKLNNYLEIGLNITPSYSLENLRGTDGHFNGSLGDGATILAALMMPPTVPARYPDGTYGMTLQSNIFAPGNSAIVSPLQPLDDPNYINNRSIFRVQGISFLNFKPFKYLTYRLSFGGDYRINGTTFYRPSTVSTSSTAVLTPDRKDPNIANIASTGSGSYGYNFSWENQVNYNRAFKGGHNINLTGVYSVQKSSSNSLNLTGQSGRFDNDLIQNVQGAAVINGTYGVQQWTLLSYLARINYDYKKKYLLATSIRTDGASRFAANKKWGTFPSISFGWRVSEEKFMKKIPVISELKVRSSYGSTGNFSIGNYGWQSLLTRANYNFGAGDGAIATGYAINNFQNNNLTWETNRQLGMGLEIGLFKNRLYFVTDLYRRLTKDLLYNRPIPGLSGFNQYLGNIGNIENKGIEFELRTQNLVNKFKWNTNFNLSINRNKVLKLGDKNEPILTTRENTVTQLIQVGQPFAVFYGYKTDGIFKDQNDVAAHPDQKFSSASGPGDTKFVDTNRDGVITDADRVILGNPTPDFSYGITNDFSYKAFDLSIQIQGVQGGDIYFLGSRFIGTQSLTQNQLEGAILNRWKSPSDPGNGNYPRTGTTPSIGLVPSNIQRYLYDGSYLRIRNVSLGYTVKPELLKKFGFRSVRVYATGQNLFTFTKYIGYNPEVNQFGESVTSIGIDYGSYPLNRSFIFGANLSF